MVTPETQKQKQKNPENNRVNLTRGKEPLH